MNTKLFLLPLSILALLIFPAASTPSQTVITFDDIPHKDGLSSTIANGYQGLDWSNFATLNPIVKLAQDGPSPTNGLYYNGMVSVSNVAFGGFSSPAEIDSPGTHFNFLSVYLTGAWRSNLNIEVQGFSGATQIYDQTVILTGTAATQIVFNYTGIDRLDFTPSGGDPALSFDGGVNFVMDNFTFEFVPEPSSLLLATAGALLLCPFLKRKRGV